MSFASVRCHTIYGSADIDSSISQTNNVVVLQAGTEVQEIICDQPSSGYIWVDPEPTGMTADDWAELWPLILLLFVVAYTMKVLRRVFWNR